MAAQRLPIGIQTFREIREEGYYYVDKTPHIHKLIEGAKHYFLSRPRRFGKSLLLDTIKELFEGNERLFQGLVIHEHWDWSVRHPTLRLSFAVGDFKEPGGLVGHISDQLMTLETAAGITARRSTLGGRLLHLISELHRETGQPVALLVDEYDKPILDALDAPEVARRNRDMLRGIYSVIKDADEHLRFSFLTGVSKFSKVSLFSGVNNLLDITLDPENATICGYTEEDLEQVFGRELEGLDKARVRDWYNGYCWRGDKRVYNPFDILLLFKRREFSPWWFETGTPTFLVDLLTSRRVPSLALDSLIAGDSLLSKFDVDDIATEALLFQTGYLTITGEVDQPGKRFYRLGFPNLEVRQGLNDHLLAWMVRNHSHREANSAKLIPLLIAEDFQGLETLVSAFYASIPSEWLSNNTIANYEGYYASVFYSYFAAVGLDITVEDSSIKGRADMCVRVGSNVLLFEFKVVEQAGIGSALAQLREKGYADKYASADGKVYLVGVEFSSEARSVVGFEVESVGQ
ncbi:MAG: AAA family ATPase [Gammaproteobacteria bacterium]|nr:AAA family ATPase [Gammaproteobacteria bacterium]